MKRLAAISLLFMLVLPYAGTQAWLHWQQKKVKKAVKWRMIDGLERDELVELKFSTAETKTKLSWKHSREFSYNGEWYDIVNTTALGDSVVYLVWHDHEETALSKRLEFVLKQVWESNPGRQEKQGRLAVFMKTLFFESVNLSLFSIGETEISILQGRYVSPEGQKAAHPESPPPEFRFRLG